MAVTCGGIIIGNSNKKTSSPLRRTSVNPIASARAVPTINAQRPETDADSRLFHAARRTDPLPKRIEKRRHRWNAAYAEPLPRQ